MMKKIRSVIRKSDSFLGKLEMKKRRDHQLKNIIHSVKSIKEYEGKLNEYKNDEEFLEDVDEFNKKYLGGYSAREWSIYLSVISGIKSNEYIPGDIFVNHIEPRLNNVAFTKALHDKNYYDLLFYDLPKSETIIRVVNGKLYDKNYKTILKTNAFNTLEKNENKLLIKPTIFTGGGKGIQVFKIEEKADLLEAISQLMLTKGSFIVQEWINQHPILASLYSKSVNTLKIITLRRKDKIVYLMTRVNVGQGDTQTDKKGYFVGVDQNGGLKNFAVKRSIFTKHSEHEDSKVKFETITIPAYKEAVELCKLAHQRLFHFDMVSWDIAINMEAKPILIEFNVKSQGIEDMQLVGGPLFGKHTMDVLREMRISLNFNI